MKGLLFCISSLFVARSFAFVVAPKSGVATHFASGTALGMAVMERTYIMVRVATRNPSKR